MGAFLTARQVELISAVIESFGEEHQIIKLIEEMSELQKELCKYLEGDHSGMRLDCISEEMADVEILLAQMYFIFSNTGGVQAWRTEKLRRLEARVAK